MDAVCRISAGIWTWAVAILTGKGNRVLSLSLVRKSVLNIVYGTYLQYRLCRQVVPFSLTGGPFVSLLPRALPAPCSIN